LTAVRFQTSVAKFVVVAGIAWIVAVEPTRVGAAVYYWDTNGAAAGAGSVSSPASWLTNSWATGSSGTLPTAAWPNASPANGDEAAFTGTSGTVTIGADVYANVVRFTAANYTVSSTGGPLHLAGANPKINVSLPSSNNVVTISAPLVSSTGFTLEGNSLSGGLKFLVLANASDATPNAFGSPLTIAAGGALRIGGGAGHEQVPDNVDMDVAGVVDFITAGGASDMKQEKVRDVTVSGAGAVFSVGNGTDFVVNSLTGTNAVNISVNGNQATVPGRLVINGWSSGAGDLTLNASTVKLNPTSATSAIGGRIVLSGNIASTGASQVINNNGVAASANTNSFTNKAFDFANAAHTINVSDGTLTFTSVSSASANALQITSLNPAGATLTKTGAGVWLYENAVQTSFTGTNRIEAGTLRIGAGERLADNSRLEVVGGAFDVQGFTETVGGVILDGGAINGVAGTLVSAADFELRSGTVGAKLGGAAGVLKTTGGSVQLSAVNSYTGDTKIAAGALGVTQPSLADVADLFLLTGATLDLNLDIGVVDTIHALFFDGVAQIAGTWGAIGSGALNESAYFTGAGKLLVSTLGLAGDFDGSGIVNAADLSQWQGDVGLNGDSDADGDGDSDGRDFLIWQANVGGHSPGLAVTNVVPEPGIPTLTTLALGALGAVRRAPGLSTLRGKA
jgi:autotransporter-associated beta strand protein